MNLGQIRGNVRANLADLGVTYYTDPQINASIQDGYNEVCAKCYNNIKSVPVPQVGNQPYYDFKALGVTDYLGAIAIFNQDTQFWLRDDISLRDFDRLRRDWEQWFGEPQFWAPHSQQYVAICPNLSVISGNVFTLWYWATAPVLALDTDIPIIATDMQNMLEDYATGDLIRTAEELTKSQPYFAMFQKDKKIYRDRCVNYAASDLLLRV